VASPNSKSKILSPNALKKVLSRKRNVVFTNGCFDLLHAGHVTYLEKAKSFGSTLVIAVNSDESVQLLKGPTRPINPLADRMRVLAALECVDYVTWFKEETPRELIIKLKPNLLVKGGDYKPSEVAGYNEIKAWGGRTRIVKLLPGRSTTSILSKSR